MPEFDINDLRKRIVDGGEYTREELKEAIAFLRENRLSSAPKAKADKKPSAKPIDLTDLL